MLFTLTAISKDNGSITITLGGDTEDEIRKEYEDFKQTATEAFGNRWYIEYTELDVDFATQEQLEFLETLIDGN